jgi:hypothetical protein
MRRALFALLALAVIGYGLFEARRLIGGPEVTIDMPIDGSAVSSNVITISGTARNISFLSINDAPAFTDETGKYSVQVSPPPGYAIFTVAATDRFGRRASAEVHITVLNYCSVNAA